MSLSLSVVSDGGVSCIEVYGRCIEKQTTTQHIYVIWAVQEDITFWINGSPDLGENIDELSSDLQKMMWPEFMITCR